jgi:hypothetical protein
MIGVGAIVDFVMRIKFPRREYVSLPCRSPLPETLGLWMSYMDTAVNLAQERIWERYGRPRNFVDLQIQHGLVRISDFRIAMPTVRDASTGVGWAGSGYHWSIKRWVASEGSQLYLLWLEWKFLQHGLVAQYYAKLDHVPEPSPAEVFRNIYGDHIQGMPNPKDIQREIAFKPVGYEDPTKAMLHRIDVERLRTPIIHTR